MQVNLVDSNYIATGSLDGFAKVFDIRKIKGVDSAVNQWLHGKGVNFVNWSPVYNSICLCFTPMATCLLRSQAVARQGR